jgi:hypothetical protein
VRVTGCAAGRSDQRTACFAPEASMKTKELRLLKRSSVQLSVRGWPLTQPMKARVSG